MKQKQSYARIIALVNFASPLLEAKSEENRLYTSLKSVFKQIGKEQILEKYNEAVTELRIKNALTDPQTRALLKDDKGNFIFSPEGQIELNKAVAELRNQEVDIHTRFNDDNIVIAERDFSYFERQVLEGFVIPEMIEEEEQDETQKMKGTAELPVT